MGKALPDDIRFFVNAYWTDTEDVYTQNEIFKDIIWSIRTYLGRDADRTMVREAWISRPKEGYEVNMEKVDAAACEEQARIRQYFLEHNWKIIEPLAAERLKKLGHELNIAGVLCYKPSDSTVGRIISQTLQGTDAAGAQAQLQSAFNGRFVAFDVPLNPEQRKILRKLEEQGLVDQHMLRLNERTGVPFYVFNPDTIEAFAQGHANEQKTPGKPNDNGFDYEEFWKAQDREEEELLPANALSMLSLVSEKHRPL